MRSPFRPFLLAVLLGGSAAVAETVAIERSRLAELEHQAAKVPGLERELAAARAELARSRITAPERPTAWVPSAVEQAVAKAPPTPAANTLPALAPGAEVSVIDLLNHYETDPVAAETRYAGRKFRVRGVIAQLDKAMFTAPYLVIFRLPGRSAALECAVSPDDRFGKVYLTSDRARVVGERGNQRVTFASVGTEVVVEGRCTGGKAGLIRFVQARTVSSP